MFESLCCDCCVSAVVCWKMYAVNLRKPMGWITVLRETRSAECVLVRACFLFSLLLHLFSIMPC